MKGTLLKNEKGEWIVEYLEFMSGYDKDSGSNELRELPLHPDEIVTNPPINGSIKHVLVTGEAIEVEFEIVEECPHYNEKHFGKDCSCKTGFLNYAKLISKREESSKILKDNFSNGTLYIEDPYGRTDWNESTKLTMLGYGDNPEDFPYKQESRSIKYEQANELLKDADLSVFNTIKQESWDEIFEKIPTSEHPMDDYRIIRNWLTQNYNSPTKK